MTTRRHLLQHAVGLGALVALRAARGADGAELEAALQKFTSGAPLSLGRVRLEVAALIENGNAVPLSVHVGSPMTAADHVRRIAVFTERNPQPDVAVFALGPPAGRASVSTRIRLATSQRLVAVAQMSDGSFWQHSVDVIVTLAACIES